MNYKHYKICTFKFLNQSTIAVAVPDDKTGKTFEEWLTQAKDIGWVGDETKFRGGLVSFEIGGSIRV